MMFCLSDLSWPAPTSTAFLSEEHLSFQNSLTLWRYIIRPCYAYVTIIKAVNVYNPMITSHISFVSIYWIYSAPFEQPGPVNLLQRSSPFETPTHCTWCKNTTVSIVDTSRSRISPVRYLYTMTVLKLIRVIIVLALLELLVASRHSSARLGAITAARYTSSCWLVWATSRLVKLFRADGSLLTK